MASYPTFPLVIVIVVVIVIDLAVVVVLVVVVSFWLSLPSHLPRKEEKPTSAAWIEGVAGTGRFPLTAGPTRRTASPKM